MRHARQYQVLTIYWDQRGAGHRGHPRAGRGCSWGEGVVGGDILSASSGLLSPDIQHISELTPIDIADICNRGRDPKIKIRCQRHSHRDLHREDLQRTVSEPRPHHQPRDHGPAGGREGRASRMFTSFSNFVQNSEEHCTAISSLQAWSWSHLLLFLVQIPQLFWGFTPLNTI